MVWKRPRRPFAGGAGSRRRAPGFECHVETDGIMRKEDGPIRHKENGAVRFRCPCPEPVVVTSPSILTHTKEPHLRSSNLNFFSPTIGVRFSFGREGGRHLAAGAKEKAGRGISSPARPFYWPTVALLPVPRGLGLVSATAEQHQSHSQERERGQRHGRRGHAGLGELANRRRWDV